jgi:hypothetical protein
MFRDTVAFAGVLFRGKAGQTCQTCCTSYWDRPAYLRFMFVLVMFYYLAAWRTSSIAMSERAARRGRRQCGPQMERQEASGSSHGPARPGTPTALKALALKALGPGSLARRLAFSEGWPDGASRSVAPPGAPFLSLAGERRKTGRRAHPGVRKQNPGTAERWLQRSIG